MVKKIKKNKKNKKINNYYQLKYGKRKKINAKYITTLKQNNKEVHEKDGKLVLKRRSCSIKNLSIYSNIKCTMYILHSWLTK
jgi:hypothetical protein